VYTGFRPAFVMVKSVDSIGSWLIHDGVRDDDNVVETYLRANLSNAETTSAPFCDFTSNGFKIRTSAFDNASGYKYIYMAFAEMPAKYSLSR